MAAMSDYLENKIIDWLIRGQSFSPAATLYIGLFTAAPSDSGGGTEVTGNNYSRASVSSSMANWAGTQSAGSTTASTGTGGTTSNNAVINFPTPTGGDWGTITHFGVFDSAVGGSNNLYLHGALTASKAVFSGDAVSIQVAQLQITLA